jgi:xylulokinase
MHIPSSVTTLSSALYGPTQAGGDSLSWFAELVGLPVSEVAGAAALQAPGADDVIFLPYLQGERAPLWDSQARGALVGLRRSHGTATGARAVLAGVAMSVRHVLEACGVRPQAERTLRVAGGASQDLTWNQIRADVTGLTVEVIDQSEASLLGAAMLAAVGAGLYPDLRSACGMAQISGRFSPCAANMTTYRTGYARYRALYPALHQVFAAVAE